MFNTVSNERKCKLKLLGDFIILQTEGLLRLKKQMTANAGVDVGRGDPFFLWVRVKAALATMEINMEFPQKARS